MVSRNFTSLRQFSSGVFVWIWALTIAAVVREVNPGLIYSCFLGSRMLGSTVFPWLMCGQSLLRLEDCLVYIYATLGIVFSVRAYDQCSETFCSYLYVCTEYVAWRDDKPFSCPR
ncbi:unnamed protein product [Brassica rapa subsp. trilocularis]|uniref:(rape) hypothetical protein n=1 Tax=Brassica napus TaxID=3708 RepID=A0A817B670_BRANA|nr:unnamed protein product [Brassica napus]